jgi:beta-galactosidase
MFFGADYYPEHWPESRWVQDAGLMKEAGMNIVRVGEFAWAKFEPSEGNYDFSWMDKALEVLYAHGIRVVMGTPTATPPKWLMDKHPDIYRVDEKGIVQGFGSRRHYCYNNPVYHQYTQKIVTAMVEHYRNNPAVAAWQIDNEFTCGDGMYCYCENCRQSFIRWLKNRYGSLDALNKAWGTVFWSQTYTDWDQIIVPKYATAAMFGNNGHNPALNLDYSRFSSDSIIDYCALQSKIIHEKTKVPVTHNVVSELYNYYDIAPLIDVASYDNYPQSPWGEFLGSEPYDPAFSMDIERGIKQQNFWVIEEQSGPCGWDSLGDTPKPGQIKLWTYQALAHGAESILYFRWRAPLFGTEQYWYGILDHDGIPRRRYREISQIGQEFPALSVLNDKSSVCTDILLIRSFEQQWSHTYQKHNFKFNYRNYLRSLYAGLYADHYSCDVTSASADFGRYKVVFAPAYNLMTDVEKLKFEEYVKNGGTLVVTFRSGTKNTDNSMTEKTLPGYFADVAGIELEEFDSINGSRTVSVEGRFGKGHAAIWADIIKPVTAEPVAWYTDEFYKGKTAVTVNRYGNGSCYYIGCDLDEKATSALLQMICKSAAVKPAFEDVPDGVEVVRKMTKDGREFLFVLNYNPDRTTLPLRRTYRNVLAEERISGFLELPGYGTAVIM